MKIAIITTGFSKNETDYGGAAAFHNYVRELSQREGIDVTIFAFYYPLNQSEYKFYGAQVFSFAITGELNVRRKLGIWRSCEKKFAREQKLRSFDVIHSMWAGESGFVSQRFARKFGIPLIANIAGGELADLEEISYGSRTKQLQKYFVDRTFSKSDIIVCSSDFISGKIKKYYGEIVTSKVRKIPFGVDENMFNAEGSAQNTYGINKLPALINIANVVPVKSHDTLFKALKIVSAAYPDIQMECYGRDDKNVLEDLAWKYGVAGNVKSDGFMDYEKIPKVFRKDAICVSSSLYESENMSIIEAAFCGLPVVSTAVGVAEEITEHTAESGDYTALAEKIIYVIENYPSEKKKAIAKRASLIDNYSLKNSVQNFIGLYNSLI